MGNPVDREGGAEGQAPEDDRKFVTIGELVERSGRLPIVPDRIVQMTDEYRASALATNALCVRNPLQFVKAADIIFENRLVSALSGNALFQDLGAHTIRALADGAKAVMFRPNNEIIGSNSASRGMFISLSPMQVRLQVGEDLEVAERSLERCDYLGEYMMVGAEYPTATAVNLSEDNLMVFISKELFDSLHPRSREAIKLAMIRRFPFLIYEDDSESGEGYGVCEAREKVFAGFAKLDLAAEQGDAIRPNYIQKYAAEEIIVPYGPGYLGLVIKGVASAFHTPIPEVKNKKTEIHAGHTVFELNAVGVEPPKDIVVSAEEDDTQILWVRFAPDDPNFERFLDMAMDGLIAKLRFANIRRAVIAKGQTRVE